MMRSATFARSAMLPVLLAGASLVALPARAADDGRVLPAPEPAFAGKIGRTTDQSVADFPARRTAPAGAPNVLVILTDDVGFGASSTFGGPVDTPTFSRLAQRGLRYNRFHTTGICSPSRAALLTGRNHHAVGAGLFPELVTGFPGYSARLPKSAATIAEVLRQNGYSTAMFGKNHNTPLDELGPTGPFDRWPTGLGFEYFYGFNAYGVDHWAPQLYENTQPVEPPAHDPAYHLDQDLADHAIQWIRTQQAVSPDKPFFAYYATGAAHAPHQAPKDWIAKYRGRFDAGWDRIREDTFARQKAAGVIPADAKLTPRPAEVPAWESLSPEQKQVAARLMEVYAAMLSYSDAQIGRVIDAIEAGGQLDNTLVIFIQGDNGASAEGTLEGSLDEVLGLNGRPGDEPLHYKLDMLDQMGGPMTYEHYPVGWAWAMDTPFQWTKQVASHFGGMRNGVVISWPRKIREGGGVRSQFHHLVDVYPTILAAAGLPAPEVVNGVKQQRVDGVSMEYSFADAAAAGRRETQYFELIGNRGLYKDGWFAGTTPKREPWKVASRPPGSAADDYQWELYDLKSDYSQAVDLAKAYPEKVAQMKAAWWAEAERNQVLPVDDSFVDRPKLVGAAPTFNGGRTHFVYPAGASRIPMSIAPAIGRRSFAITADVVVPAGGADGVLATFGGRFGGWGFVVLDGEPVAIHALSQQARHKFRVAGGERLPSGPARIVFEVRYADGRGGGPAEVAISVNGRAVAAGTIPRTLPSGVGSGPETFDVGRDTGTPVAEDYKVPFAYAGKLESVTVDLR